MSQSLLKRCLQLVEEDLPETASSKQKKQSGKQKSKKNTIFDMIPEQKRLTITTKGKNNIKQKVNKIKTTEKFTVKQAKDRMKRSNDRIEENVNRQLALDSELKLDDQTKELMIRRARTGHYVVPLKVEKEEEDVFTAEDFAKFEREYFPK